WPPSRIDGVLPVSPETESPRMECPVSHEQVFFNGSLIDVAVSSDAPAVRGLHVWLHWPEPFHALFPLIGCNLELLHHHHVVMRACIKQWQDGDKDGALREADFWVSRLTCEAQTTVEKGWFLPKAKTNSEEALYALQGDYQVEVNNLDDVPNSSGFRAIRHTLRPVERVQDWLGYFWFELYHELKAYEIVGTCVDCGRVFRGGHRDRTKCSRTDN